MISLRRNAGVISIDDIEIVDPVLYAMLDDTKMDDRPALLADIVEVGARVLQRAQDGTQGELLRREVDRLQEMLGRDRRDLIDLAGNDFAEAVKQVMDNVAQHLALISGRLDGVLAVAEAKQETASERERSTAKGRPFEEAVAIAVEAIAAHNGDTCEHVGDVMSAAGRAGDVLVGIDGAGGPVRGWIVFEAKTGRLTRPEAMREMDRAREQRDADFSVMVVARTIKMPSQTRPLHEYGGDKIVVVFDVDDETTMVGLELAYALARARVLMTKVDSGSIDVAAAQASIEKVILTIDSLRHVKSSLSSIQKNIEQLKGSVDALTTNARGHIQDISAALQSE